MTEQKIKDTFFIIFILLLLVTLWSVATAFDADRRLDKLEDKQELKSCHEDEPCWNCHTMGNKICGDWFPNDDN